MTGFFRVILFLILFLIVIKVVKMIARYFLSHKKTVDNINQQRSKKPQRFDDVEEADFKEIPSENKKEKENN
ncbi:MAG: hypothetical protein IH950_00560 [Bacteroidetes bacterium]|nr:hypothetical protein [Bacteroidota bacterium]MCH8032232.1 hypothetical protein [Bacteroidota bacterium]